MLNSKTFGQPIKEVEPLEVEDVAVNEDTKEETKVKSSIILFQLEDDTLGLNTAGEVGLAEVTMFTEYLNRF